MIRFVAVALMGLSVCACAPHAEVARALSAAAQAERDCGGQAQSWSLMIYATEWPYRRTSTETFRCMKDARFVGPYVTDLEPL